MPRKRVPLHPEFPFHITARCINREWFAMPMDDVWRIMSNQLQFIHHAFEIQIIAFVLMGNHFHLIVRTPLLNLSEAMRWFMTETSREITKSTNRINQTYGGKHYRSLINTNLYFLNAYKYLYFNPVKAGLISRVENYPYSTLPGLLGKRRMNIPLEEDLTLFSDLEGTMKWLNTPVKEEHWECVRKALRRKEFSLPKKDFPIFLKDNAL